LFDQVDEQALLLVVEEGFPTAEEGSPSRPFIHFRDRTWRLSTCLQTHRYLIPVVSSRTWRLRPHEPN
jgi:hypothetical protein